VKSNNSRTVLITGANGGIGLAVGRTLLEDADTVVYLGVRSGRKNAEKLAVETPDQRCRVLELDVTVAEQWTSAVSLIVEETGRLDVLVNCAGFHRDVLLASMSDDEWSDVLQANLDGVFFGCRAVTRTMMAQRWGRIIHIASLSALLAPMGQANYAAAKAGVLALSQSFAKEVARAGITVNTLCPGYIETEALVDQGEARKKELARQIPMRRFGKPEEVAAAVKFLASEEASYITSSVMKIDGGIF